MTYAIIEIGGKQLWAEPGRFYDVERMEDESGTILELSQVLLINHEDTVTLGHPLIEGATVRAQVLEHRKARKVIVYKMQPKKKTRKKNGHRQLQTRLLIEAISLNGSVLAESAQWKLSDLIVEADEADTEADIDLTPPVESADV
ncbi:MAG: 50S ribosomal protein L21 [Synechococcaceae cyanobacterium SM2_3_2]|nr:50S ribosomal protein L21 [Synechococcaceae cyanobacterium SM2_3_2]